MLEPWHWSQHFPTISHFTITLLNLTHNFSHGANDPTTKWLKWEPKSEWTVTIQAISSDMKGHFCVQLKASRVLCCKTVISKTKFVICISKHYSGSGGESDIRNWIANLKYHRPVSYCNPTDASWILALENRRSKMNWYANRLRYNCLDWAFCFGILTHRTWTQISLLSYQN